MLDALTHGMIRVRVELRNRECSVMVIEMDESSTEDVANYDVALDDLGQRRWIKARVEGWKRRERTGIELIGEAFRVIAEQEAANAS